MNQQRKEPMPDDKKPASLSSQNFFESKEQQMLLNNKAKKAALAGLTYLVESYRKRGAHILSFARAVGISGKIQYAEFIVAHNQQLGVALINELTLGLYAGGHSELAREFSKKFHSGYECVFQEQGKNRYQRGKDVRVDILKYRLQTAREQVQKTDIRTMIDRLPSFSSEDSFSLSE